MPLLRPAQLVNPFLQEDVSPALIMTRVEAASGVNYTAQKEAPRKFEPIAPVGSSYKPVGKVDINALRNAAPAPAPAASKPIVSSARPVPPAAARPTPAAGEFGRPAPAARSLAASNTPSDAWPEEESFAPPPPPPAASRPVPTAPRPVATTPAARFSPAATAPPPSASNVPTKPSDDDKIGPVGTAYTPIKLQPKKLVNPFQAMQSQQAASTPASAAGSSGPKKLTWSERQAQAKKQQQEEEARAQAALGSQPTPPPAPAFRGAVSVPRAPPVVSTPEPEPEEEYIPPVST